MKIYHVTDFNSATNILISGVIMPKNEKVYFCQSYAGAKSMLAWWTDIKFKPDTEKVILELSVQDTKYTPDPHTSRFGGCITNQSLIIIK